MDGHQAIGSNFQFQVTPQLQHKQQFHWNKNHQEKGKRKKALMFAEEIFVVNTNVGIFYDWQKN